MAALQGFDCDVYLTDDVSTAAISESATDTGDKIHYTMSVHKYWDKNQPFTVQCSPNGSTGWVTVVDYTMQWVGGVITFNTARVAATNNFVKVLAGNYYLASQAADTHTWELSVNAAVTDVTCFQSQWKTYVSTVKDTTAKISTYKPDNTFLVNIGMMVVLILYLDKSANMRYETYAWITKITPKSDASSVISQEVDFTVESAVYYQPS